MKIKFLHICFVLISVLLGGSAVAKQFGTLECTQYQGPSEANNINQIVLKINVPSANGGGTACIEGMHINLLGTSQLTNAKLYYTGTTDAFSTTTLKATVSSFGGGDGVYDFDFSGTTETLPDE